jgi:hypothetical protein
MGVFSRWIKEVHPIASRPRRASHRQGRPAPDGLRCEELEQRLVLSAACPSDPISRAECAYAIQTLTPTAANLTATQTTSLVAVKSGDWADPATWGGQLPTASTWVSIPKGITVTIAETGDVARIVTDYGALTFATIVNTSLQVDTIFTVSSDDGGPGYLTIGTANNPVQSNVSCTITFMDDGALNQTWDPQELSRGLIAHGVTSIYGSTVTSYVALAQSALGGQTTLILATVPTNWQVGDQLVLTGTNPNSNQDEQLQILGINGNQVTVSPLAYNHVPPAAGLSVYVADLTRNVTLTSQNTTNPERFGHVMFMHSDEVQLGYAAFDNLGRTLKADPIGTVLPDGFVNVRGRYAVHFHRELEDNKGDPPVPVVGCVVDGSPGWGYVNHSSNVDFVNNVAFNVLGAAFVTEAGNEIGAFIGNLAIRSQGSGQSPGARAKIQDFGHNGVGFWFQGPGVAVENNIAVGQAYAGFFYYTQGLTLDGVTIRFSASNLPNPAWANGQKDIAVSNVPIWDFKGNIAFASANDGLDIWYNLYLPNNPQLESVVQDFTAWGNSRNGVQINYSGQLTIENSWVLGNLQNPLAAAGITGNNNYFLDITYNNVRVEGFAIGIEAPGRGANNVFNGGYFNNIKNIDIVAESPIQSRDRVISIQGNPQFGTLPGGVQQFNVYLEPQTLRPLSQDITLLFRPEHNLLNTVTFNGKQLYFLEQAANFVPFPAATAPSYIPPALIGLTNQQLWQQYGVAINGAVAPPDAVPVSGIHGLLGSPAVYPPEYTLVSAKYTNRLNAYQLVYMDANGNTVKVAQLFNLVEGWNLLTVIIGGMPRTFLVNGNTTPPVVTISPFNPTSINPADLANPFTLMLTVYDNSVGYYQIAPKLTGLDKLPVLTAPDGSKYIVVKYTVKDPAGNTTTVSFDLTLDPNAPK